MKWLLVCVIDYANTNTSSVGIIQCILMLLYLFE